jgi:LPS export ABC transporter protein LptC
LLNIFTEKHLNFVVALSVTVLMFLTVACSSDKKNFLPNFKDRATVPGMYTDSVTTLISDSGRIRYRIFTAVWKVFDKVKDPYWCFPKKIYLERFNDSLKVESLVQCDTARYYSNRKLWELKKNVKLINIKGDKFETSFLCWDQNQQRIYSDSFIRIQQQDQIITGYGFESNETLTKYTISKPQSRFPMDSPKSDSLGKGSKSVK